MMKELNSQGDSFQILKQLEHILQCDTLIDEVGFIHPSQFTTLNEDTGGLQHPSVNNVPHSADEINNSNLSDVNILENSNTIFWNRDHKLAISTQVLLPLYTAAKHAFKIADRQYKMLLNLARKADISVDETAGNSSTVSEDFLESEVMTHSKALLLLSCDFATAWNSRKLVLSTKQNFPLFMDELLFSALILSYSPKSEHAWNHRRWVIKTISGTYGALEEIAEKESKLVEKIAEKSKMNYRAWNHRCWLISYLTRRQVLDELKKSRKWAELHVADNCCFHYRRQLLLRMLEQSFSKHGPVDPLLDIYHFWKEELHWNQMLIKRYVGREALWVHRRFLSQCWIKHFTLVVQDGACHYEDDTHVKDGIGVFMDVEIQLFRSCLTIPDNDFEDWHTQAVLAAAYILWISKQIPPSEGRVEVQEKLKEFGDLKTLLIKLCPEKTLLWDGLIG
ncbi:Protein prenyltransferase [Macleaya cordata]|uniref:Protein prenyltransferase n=1 Tax=Macleaya cordata TaxID=56857 RepID=A0A200PVY2_MACCD|nr:Protein prenyltransferase [Macleaya cordata]